MPDVGEMLRYRELAIVLALRDLQVRYKQTLLGLAWAIVQPLAATGAITLVFGRFANLDSGSIPYPVFALAGLLGWSFFASGLSRASMSLVENEDMVTKIYFPRMLVCIAAVLPGIVDFGVGLALLAVLMLIGGVAPGPSLLALPVILLALFTLTTGAGCLCAALNVRYRDVRHIIPFILQIGIFITPVAYSSALATGAIGLAYHLNPVAGLIDALRWTLLDARPPRAEALASLGVGLLVVIIGLWTFARTERRFADVI